MKIKFPVVFVDRFLRKEKKKENQFSLFIFSGGPGPPLLLHYNISSI